MTVSVDADETQLLGESWRKCWCYQYRSDNRYCAYHEGFLDGIHAKESSSG